MITLLDNEMGQTNMQTINQKVALKEAKNGSRYVELSVSTIAELGLQVGDVFESVGAAAKTQFTVEGFGDPYVVDSDPFGQGGAEVRRVYGSSKKISNRG